MSNAALNLNDADFAKFMQDHAHDLVLVDFFASWCHHCQNFGPIFEDVARSQRGGKVHLVKVDVEECSTTANQYQIEVLPTLVTFKNGQELSRHTGSQTKEFVEKLIADHLKS